MVDNNSNQQIPLQQRSVQITAKEFASKYNSKRECYTFLAVDVGVYLPAYEQISVYFLKDIIAGSKKCKYPFDCCLIQDFNLVIKGKDVRHIVIPQFYGLTLQDVGQFCNEHPLTFDYLPEPQEIHKVPKQWLCNVINSVVKETFSQWVKQQVEIRNNRVKEKKNMMIQMDPEIARAYQQSTAVSLTKGIGANLLKIESKRRRTMKQIEEEKQAELNKENEYRSNMARFDEMQLQLQKYEQQAQIGQNAANLMSQLIEEGVVNQEDPYTISGTGSKGRKTFTINKDEDQNSEFQ